MPAPGHLLRCSTLLIAGVGLFVFGLAVERHGGPTYGGPVALYWGAVITHKAWRGALKGRRDG